MTETIKTGRHVAMEMYIGKGLLTFIACLLDGRTSSNIMVSYVLVWVIGLCILVKIKCKTSRSRLEFTLVEVLFSAIMICGLCFIMGKGVLIVYGFFADCLTIIFFITKRLIRIVLYVYVSLAVFMTLPFVAEKIDTFRIQETIATVVCFGVFAELAIILIDLIVKREKETLRQEQSLDDMLRLVEAKCDEAREASSTKSNFLARMSHEIRTPINAVLGLDTMILRESKENAIKNYALDIQNEGQILLSLINDILDLSKIESGKLEILPVQYDFSSLLYDVVNMIYFKAQEKGLEVKLNVDENLPAEFFGDDIRIRQILVNIMNNAVKYTETGSVTLEVNGDLDDNAMILHFKVIDTGIGIKQEDLGKLFAEFERITDERTRNVEGTGLGMSITLQLLAMMDSKLMVDSVYGQGSTFYFDLRQPIMNQEPIGKLEERVSERREHYEYTAAFVDPDLKILVVDDNAANRKVFLNLLKETKAQIFQADDGTTCLQEVEKQKFDIIFLDHMMPGMDGIETLHLMKQMKDNPNYNTPVIALTANAITGAREMYLTEGFDDFLSKPIRPEKLENMICEKLGIEANKVEYSMESEEAKESRMSQLEGIDWDYAMLNMGSAQLIVETARDFCNMCESDRLELEDYYQVIFDMPDGSEGQSEGYNQFRIKVHSMKTSAAMIGAIPLSGVAKLLEFAARDHVKKDIKHLAPIFFREWNEMGNRLSEMFEDKNAEKKEVDVDFISECMELLKNSIADMEIDTADEIIKQLGEYAFSEEVQKLYDKLLNAVSNINEESVVELSDKIVEILKKDMEAENNG